MSDFVSILMPMRDAAPYVVDALGSLLVERTIPLEVLVIDDGSRDGSAALVAGMDDPRIRLIPGPEQGIAAAFNAGLAAAQGDILMRCDADDLYLPGRIARQRAWLAENPAYEAVCGDFTTLDRQGNLIRRMAGGDAPAEITTELRQGRTRTHFGTFAVRTAALRAIDGCRPYFYSAEDIDLQLRLGESARVFYLPEPSYAYRLHDDSHCHTMDQERRRFFDQIARTFQAERQRDGRDALMNGRAPRPPEAAPGRWPARLHQQGILLGLAWQEHAAGRRRQALAAGWRSVRAWPGNPAAWRSLLALLLKPARR